MNENAENLLKRNLKTMYYQTNQWIEDVEFYQQELDFFNNLISNKIGTTTTDNLEHKEIFRNIDALLFRVSEDLISQIKLHRKEVSELIDTNQLLGHHSTNKNHLNLLEKMTIVKHGIKKLKKALFKYVENHPFEFDFDTVLKELQ